MSYTTRSLFVVFVLTIIIIVSSFQDYKNVEGFASKNPFKEISKMGKGLSKILGFFTYLGKFFKWIGEIIQCSIETIIGIPNCFMFYLFDIFVGFIMMMIKLFCSFSPTLERARKMVGKIMKQMDKMLYSMTGFHFLEYPKSIVKKCYKCQNKKMPKMKL